MSANLIPSPALDTWQAGQLVSADELNINVRDVQKFLAYAPLTIVQRNATQSISSGVQSTITWDTEIIDVDGMVSTPSANLTVRRPGVYAIQFESHFVGNTGGAIRSAHIAINGSWVGSSNNAPSGSASCLNSTAIVALNTGDVITGMVYQDSGSALNSGGGYNAPRLSVRLVSTAALDINYANPQPPPSKPPTPGTPSSFTKTYYATWSRSYDGDLATTWDDSALCFQGYEQQYRGMTRSLAGFNYSQIQSDLSGATNIRVKVTYKVLHTWYNAGGTIIIGTHKYTSKPGTWSSANVYESQFRKSGCSANHSYTLDMGKNNWYGWAFQQGVVNGIAFGPAPDTSLTYYGYMAGATQGGKPYLTISYTK